ncbi:MAG: hypothetical protein JNK73_03335 [Bacteroidia bacterium]|nr:hypothetical protein [Bacteroidia bacterium]
METFFIIIGILVVVIIFKFVYDTYLTDNTDKNFEEYRKSDPIGAAEIERPKTPQQFNDLVDALTEEQVARSMKKLSSNYNNFKWVMKEFSEDMEGMKLISDTENNFIYKVPVLTYGKVMGQINYILTKHENNKAVIFIRVDGNNDEKIETNKVILDFDIPKDEYIELIQSLQVELVSNQAYLNLTTKGFM